MPRELELKFEIASRDADLLGRAPSLAWAPVTEQRQLTVFYDTPKRKLRKAGFMLRLRKSGSEITQTVKANGREAALFDRTEWEWPLGAMRPHLRLAAETPLGRLLTGRTRARIRSVARMRIDRATWAVDDGDSLIEVTSDRGIIQSGGARGEVSEVELELKRGGEAALFDLADKLAKQAALRLGVLSKADRANALRRAKLGRPWKAPRTGLDEDMSVSAGLSAIVFSCLKHFRLNEPVFVDGHDPEALHQMRVAIRRLRSALDLFEPAADGDEVFAGLKDDFRLFSRKFGEARNLDVFVHGLGDAAAGMSELRHARDELYARTVCALDSRRFLRFMLWTVRWLSVGRWRESDQANAPLDAFLNRRIGAMWERVSASRESLAELSDNDRHKLRIQFKKLRYALEFAKAMPIGTCADAKPFAAALERLQDQLGQLNDMRIARRLSRKYGVAMPEHAGEEARRAAILDKAEHSMATLVAIGPYWREQPRRPAAAVARRRAGSTRPAVSRTPAPRSGGCVRG